MALLLTHAGRHHKPATLARAARFTARAFRFAGWAAGHPVTFGRTATRAAKLLPTVRHAIPRWIWPILALAALVKCIPLDFGTDEALFCLAFALIAITRPGLLPALWAEASAGKATFCQCGPCSARWERKQARRAELGARFTRNGRR